MAENLDYNVGGSSCGYGNILTDMNTTTCNTYGRLYHWVTAMALPSNCNHGMCASQIDTKHRGICPEGWHIPNNDEWNTLINFVGNSLTAGRYLKATFGWNSCGNDNSYLYQCEDKHGFSALPGGYGYSGSLRDLGNNGYWLSSTEYSNDYAYIWTMSYDNEETSLIPRYKIDPLYSVRCLKD